MKDYSFSETTVNGITHYYTTFVDGEGKEQTVEVNKEVYDTLNQSQQRGCSQTRKDRRYGLCSFDETLGGVLNSDDAEKTQELLSKVQEHMGDLSEVQRRRLYLYFEEGLTLKQIAQKEGVCYSSVHDSIISAIEILRSKKY